MPKPNNTQVQQLSWQEGKTALQDIRHRVFIEEQQVPAELEWDDEDLGAAHFLLTQEDGQALACARLLASGQIGRMAALAPYRAQGLGRQLLTFVIDWASQHGYPPLFLHAQNHAITFYESMGFVVEGDEFIDAGIPHHTMNFQRK
ncbi:MAG TPA: GNAT family N-acetyltransferase [Pseudomonadales bacterium]|nr:GNAT family N-acetyltransferase [Pseudomonadales bacterium]